jgi:predicted  nucleic acid-binding Zn-ribbon protein
VDIFSDNLMQGFTGALIIGVIMFYAGRRFSKKDRGLDISERVAKLETIITDNKDTREKLVSDFKEEIERIDTEIGNLRIEVHAILAENAESWKEFQKDFMLEFDKLGTKLIQSLEKLSEKMACEFNKCPKHDRQT